MSGPVAYFITFTTCGTRLHGDERGTVDRLTNRVRTDVNPTSPARRRFAVDRMEQPAIRLDRMLRPLVEHSIRETCTATSAQTMYISWCLR